MKLTLRKSMAYRNLIESRENGKYIGLPYNILSHKRSDLTERVRAVLSELKCPYVIERNEEAESLVWEISQDLVDGEITMRASCQDDYFLQATPHIIIHVVTYDEYAGFGESETYSSIEGLMLEDEVTREEIMEVVNWMSSFVRKENVA